MFDEDEGDNNKTNKDDEDGNNKTDNKDEEKETKCGASEGTIKCLANYGTNVGEDLCCGQTGVLQNTEYVCPEEMPNLKFSCGSTFGYCHNKLYKNKIIQYNGEYYTPYF